MVDAHLVPDPDVIVERRRLAVALAMLATRLAVIVMSYFVGQLGNTLPLPGGIGGVEGGIVGALVGFGEPPGLALAAVLTYRAFAFWLPTLPGAVAYVQLTRTLGHPDR